jgi:hypothetical protein
MNWNGTISLLLACIEIILLVNVFVFTKAGKFRNIASIMIALLAVYQFFEFLMCQVELQNPIFPYLAFFDITFLPPLNLLLILTPPFAKASGGRLTLNLNRFWLRNLIFLPAIFFVVYYTFSIPKFEVTSCTVLYATYHYPLGDLFGVFYYLPILISIVLLILFIKKEEDGKNKLIGKVLLFGEIVISLPVLIAFSLMFAGSYDIITAIESIMCKFAFIYAVCLSFVCIYKSKKEG